MSWPQSIRDRGLFEPPCFLEVLRSSFRNMRLLGKLSWNLLCCLYSRRAFCIDIRFSLVRMQGLKVAVTNRQVTQYEMTFARGAVLQAARSSFSTFCMSVVPNTSTLEYVTSTGGPAWQTEQTHVMQSGSNIQLTIRTRHADRGDTRDTLVVFPPPFLSLSSHPPIPIFL